MRAFGGGSRSRSDCKASLKPRRKGAAELKPAAKVGDKERGRDEGARSPSPRTRGRSRRQSPSPAAEPAASPSPASEAAAEPEEPAASAHRKRRRRKRTAEEKEARAQQGHRHRRRRRDAGSPAEDEAADDAAGSGAGASPEEQAAETPEDAADASPEGGGASPDPRRQQVGVVEESAEEKLFAAVKEAAGAREGEQEPKAASDRGARRRKHAKKEGVEEAERSRTKNDAEAAEEEIDKAKQGRRRKAREVELARESLDRSEAAAGEGSAEPKEPPEKLRSTKNKAENREKKPKKEKKHKEHHKKKAKGPNQNGEDGKQQESEAAVARFRAMIRDIYKRKNPAKLEDVDELLAKYAGAEEELYESICEKYGEEPKRAGAAAPPRAQPPGFAAATRGFARKASAPPPPPAPALAPAPAHNGEAPQEGGWPFVEEFSMNSEESDCSSDLSCAQAHLSAAGAASRPAGPPPDNLYDDLMMAPGQRARVRVAKAPAEHVVTGFGAGIFGAEAPPPPKRPPGTFAAPMELPAFLGHWRDTMGNEVQVEWAPLRSRGGQLDVTLSKPRGGREPIKLNVKAKGSGRFACGHFDLDTQNSTLDRIIWLDARKGKDSVWERPSSGHKP